MPARRRSLFSQEIPDPIPDNYTEILLFDLNINNFPHPNPKSRPQIATVEAVRTSDGQTLWHAGSGATLKAPRSPTNWRAANTCSPAAEGSSSPSPCLAQWPPRNSQRNNPRACPDSFPIFGAIERSGRIFDALLLLSVDPMMRSKVGRMQTALALPGFEGSRKQRVLVSEVSIETAKGASALSCKSLNLTWRTSHGTFKLSDIHPNSATAVHVSFSGWPTILEIARTNSEGIFSFRHRHISATVRCRDQSATSRFWTAAPAKSTACRLYDGCRTLEPVRGYSPSENWILHR